ncbi:MAG: pantoate--beta-alanine ligase, partial [Acidimicrobiales bacterium]
DVTCVSGRDRLVTQDAAHGVDIVVLAVPDAAIAEVSASIHPGPAVVVHLAGSLGLEVLAPHARRAALHPLAPMPDPEVGSIRLAGGIFFAHAGDDAALEIVHALGGRVIDIDASDRDAYHAAACVASNHVVGVLGQAERIGAKPGLGRQPLISLARFALDDVDRLGPQAALTGPAARGDDATLLRHTRAIGAEELAGYRAGADLAARLAGRPATSCGPETSEGPPTFTSGAELSAELEAMRAQGRTVGFVPTMGALHRGHTSLIARARAECDVVVTSIFVNPTQFGPGEDLESYPRTPTEDLARARTAGTDLVFMPEVDDMYPPGAATTVIVGGPSAGLETQSRPGHFQGVATVVTRLLVTVGRCRVYFGEKDFQQLIVVRRLVADLGLPAEIVGCPTVRQPDGVALSSRNARLSAAERAAAPILYQALRAGRGAVESGQSEPSEVVRVMAEWIGSESQAELDYAAVVDPSNLVVPERLCGEVRLLVAARLGSVRLLDNLAATSPATPPGRVATK